MTGQEQHDKRCEAEFVNEAGQWTPCGCSYRASGDAGGPPCAGMCRAILIRIMADRGTEVVVTWVMPLFHSGFEPLNMSCSHGVPWYMEPTSEQRLRYMQDNT